ncbi:A1pp-domain-containing protein [Delitschia confertaspora ATCC 74209]|uniref:A1pp-domain-containing protein n=1 Tax=Delitschia confertaspora ATCC 74209 TaxID=1513339 RepID=A0A9P4MV14_9PLEO|nr:A1pp-domain-containing protein [Delitschia confertaspora ATCC 74209]
MADPLPLSEIPTLSLLYKLNHISLPENIDVSSLPPPSIEFNDKISVIRHDITLLEVDSIVNAANESLLGGGGVDGAIHRAAGPNLFDECNTLGGCATGSAKITDGYRLPAKKVIHAVGPKYWLTRAQGRHSELLSGCYRRSLELAVENGLKSIAFSALSTGIYAYPSVEASMVALDTVRKFLDEGKGDTLDRIIFCNFMKKDEDAYFTNIPKFFPPVIAESENTEDNVEEVSTNEVDLAAMLPDAPKTDPVSPGQPSLKRRKTKTEGDEEVTVEDEHAGSEDLTKADK